MDYTIKIDSVKGTADIEFGKSDIFGEYKRSPNGKYYMICDTLYTSNGGREHTVLFTENEVLYKKALPNEASAMGFGVYDDGRSIIVTDKYFLSLDSAGKQLCKKNVCLKQNGFNASTFWGLGENDEGAAILLLYDMEKAKSLSRVIPDIEYDDEEKEDQFSSEVEAIFTGEKFVFVYENRIDAVAYDLTGTKVAPTDEEIAQANAQRDEHEREERLRQIEKAKSSYQYWSERLAREKKEGKSSAEIERSTCEVEKHKQKLLEFGVEVPEMPAPEEDPKPCAAKPKKSFFAQWLRK